MIHHVLRFRFKPGVPAETQEGLMAEMAACRRLAAVHDLILGASVATPPDPYSHAMVVTVKDEPAYREYAHHPDVRDAEKRAEPYLESIAMFDIVDPADPGLPTRLARIRMERP